MRRCLILTVIAALFLCGCVSPRVPPLNCTILFEDNESLSLSKQDWQVKQNGSLTVTIGVPTGERIASVSHGQYSLSRKLWSTSHFDYYDLTLHQIRYSTIIRITTAPAYTTSYHGPVGEPIEILEESPHLFFNTLPYRGQFQNPGFVAVGWNTASDGTGQAVGFGSRIDHRAVSHLDLYMDWRPESPATDFTYEIADGQTTVTGYHGAGDVVIPMELGGCPVTAIAGGAFGDLEVDTLVLSPNLKTLAPGAFGNVKAEHFYFFDDLEGLTEDSFQSYSIRHVHIQAVKDPVYSTTYFDTFSDKMDYLDSLREEQKIVIFCGSSARFGYDSEKLQSAFAGYRVANMGVYAYSNMAPLADLVRGNMNSGDILISSPELDAIDTQFCGETAIMKETYCLMESNFDLFARLDCTKYTEVFAAWDAFHQARAKMEPRSYLESAWNYDEDENPTITPSYNQYGDYILYRENNSKRVNFGIKRAFYNKDHIRPQDLEGLNRMYDSFLEKGVAVYYIYSARSNISISDDSNPQTVAELDAYLRENLHVPVISPIDESLMDPLYFYGTDNHLSTEGVQIYTSLVIGYLRSALAE